MTIFLRKCSKILSKFPEKWSKLHVFYITLVIKTLEPDIMFILFFFSLGQSQYRLRKKKFIEKSSRSTKLQLLKKIYCQYFPLCYQNRRFLAHQRDIYIYIYIYIYHYCENQNAQHLQNVPLKIFKRLVFDGDLSEFDRNFFV